ncbi:MAG: TetR/AcrR family transcriptional regulator C-terminal domain-containing protein [Lutisporaceae bacterium]
MTKEFESAKVVHTKQVIKDKFIDLYINRSIDSIRIKEITDKAGINRGTFYIHYEDIYDLLDEVEDELISVLDKNISKIKELIAINSNLNTLKPIITQNLEYIRERSKYFKAFLGANGSPSFLKKLKNIAKTKFLDNLKTDNKPEEHGDYLIEYIVSANVGIIVYWLESGMKISADELTNLMSSTLFRGPLTFINS